MRQTACVLGVSVITTLGLVTGSVTHAQQAPQAQTIGRMNDLLTVFERGQTAFGQFAPSRDLGSGAQLSRNPELDFVMLDMEHSPYDISQFRIFMASMLDPAMILKRGRPGTDHPVMARIPAYGREMNQWMAKQVLDSGAKGVMFPHIETVEQAMSAVRAMRYAQRPGAPDYEPNGQRGWDPSNAIRYWGVTPDIYRAKADLWPLDPNGELVGVLQIENELGVKNVREILKQVKGITVIFASPGDLGTWYQQDPKATEAALQTILAAAKEFKVPCSMGAIVPGVRLSRPDVGGHQSMEQVWMMAHGADNRHSTQQVDGMLVNTNWSDGLIQQYHDDALFAEVTVQTSAPGADVQAGGVRVNMIPKDGGNMFKAAVFLGGTDGKWQSNNITPELRAKGLTLPNGVAHIQNFNGSLGGPIRHDKLWFFTSARHVSVDEKVANAFMPDGSPAIVDQYVRDGLLRLTLQVSQKHKVAAYWERIWKRKGREFTAGVDPVEAAAFRDPRHAFYGAGQAKWTSTLSNRLLFELGYSYVPLRVWSGYQPGIEQVPFTAAWYARAAHIDIIRSTTWNAKSGGVSFSPADRHLLSSAVSYVTGTHNFKAGVQWSFGQDRNTRTQNADLNQIYRDGIPEFVDVLNTPLENKEYVNYDIGIYAQDAWTLKRLTVTPGIRFELFNSEIQAVNVPAGRFAPERHFPTVKDMPNWRDVAPRFSAVYDLFGNQKTALKLTVNKYVLPWSGGWAKRYDPSVISTDRRDWKDLNGDDIAQDNEIGPSNNLRFGVAPSRQPAPGLERESNVEYSLGVQRELMPRVSVTAAWYRRRFYNVEKQFNTLVSVSDYTPFQAPNPLNNGEQITIYNLNRAKQGQVSIVDTNSAINTRIYNGFEVSFTARLPHGAMAFGGWTAERLLHVTCDTNDPNQWRFCDERGKLYPELGRVPGIPFKSDFKFAGTYPLPLGLEVSATLLSYAGKGQETGNEVDKASLDVNWVVPASVFPNGQRTQPVTVKLIPPGTKFLKRWNQLDLNFTKNVRVGNHRYRGEVGVYNALNSSVVLSEIQTLGSSLGRPTTILQGRLLRLAFLMDF